MASRDQAIGAIIFIVCLVVGIGYTISLFWPEVIFNAILNWGYPSERIQFWLVAIPMFIAIVVVLAIGAWIGWTMGTTPPPKPLEEIEAKEKPEPTEEEKTEGKEEK